MKRFAAYYFTSSTPCHSTWHHFLISKTVLSTPYKRVKDQVSQTSKQSHSEEKEIGNHSIIDLVFFYNTSTRNERHECNTNDTSAARVGKEQYECNKGETRATRVRPSETRELHEQHQCDTSSIRTTQVRHEWEILILITTRVTTYFHTPILAIWQIKDYKERNNFILRNTFWKCLIPLPKCIWKVHHKNWTL